MFQDVICKTQGNAISCKKGNPPDVLLMEGGIAVPSTIEITEAAGLIDIRCCNNKVDAIGIDWLEAPIHLRLELLCSEGAGDNVKYIRVIQFVSLLAHAHMVNDRMPATFVYWDSVRLKTCVHAHIPCANSGLQAAVCHKSQ